ncbi:hypothetical protein GGS24DRAFT_502362 [Hypoxylon argillaceum]|nr:hypothetical protein GGS24DRAFT_502362 [Hypoxylon argillaceum]KAI1150781.1 hypothetical protein F4825DRAFT_389147 [Nemania diffusa]
MKDSFPQFPRLPTELRLQIWAATVEPRVLRVGLGEKAKTAVADWSVYTNPAGLSVCTESRAVLLKHYTASLPIYWYHQMSPLRYAMRYINSDLDIVFIDPAFESEDTSNWGQINGDFNLLMSGLRPLKVYGSNIPLRMNKPVRRMAIPSRWWFFRWSQPKPYILPTHLFFSDLREIIVLADPDDEEPEEGTEPSSASLLPTSVQEYLQETGWDVQMEGQALTVTKLSRSAYTRIHRETMAFFGDMEIPPAKPAPNDAFYFLAPGFESESPSCMPGIVPRQTRDRTRQAPP